MLEERLGMLGFDQVDHFMYDHIFQHVAWLLDEFGVDPDRPTLGVAASPFCLHPLEEVTANLHTDAGFPLEDPFGNCLMEKPKMPLVHDARALVPGSSRPNL